VTYPYVWGTIIVAQIVLGVLVVTLALVSRSRQRSGGGDDLGADSLATSLRGASADAILGALARLAPSDATRVLAVLERDSVVGGAPAEDGAGEGGVPDHRGALAEALRRARGEPWATRVLDGARSLLWWRRLAAARLLGVVADARDRGAIRVLLQDPHPGVQSAATACLRRYADDDLVALVIDALSSRSSAVRAYQVELLAERRDVSAPLLLERLRADAPPHKLYAYIYAAEAMDVPAARARVSELSTHPHPEVRVAVARLLKNPRDERTRVKLLALLRDEDWRVRAQAARALAGEMDERTVQELSRALTDPTWWVRFRAALALAGGGAPGRAALTAARAMSDRYARDMAALVSDLPEASLAELAAG